MPDFTPAQQVAFKAILDAYTLLTEADIALHKLMEQAAKAKIALEAAMQAGSGSSANTGRDDG